MDIEYILQNPQVCAAIVTAIFGILGILINIIINISFRNRDYKNKNRINNIEHIESYYMPLYNLVSPLIETIKALNADGEPSINIALAGQMGSANDHNIKPFTDSIKDLQRFLCEKEYKFLDDYKLFKSLQVVKHEICYLYQHINKNNKLKKELTFSQLLEELEVLIYRIQINEAKILVDNPLRRMGEYCSIWLTRRKGKKM